MVATPKISKSALAKFYSLEDARNIPGPFVYGLHDGDKIFYVGKTVNARARFSSYAPARKAPLPLLRAIKAAGQSLSVVILEHNPPDLSEAESRHITTRCGDLVNRVASPVRMRASVRTVGSNMMVGQHIATCPHCAGENVKDGKHLCRRPVDILTPRANPEMQAILRKSGILRG